MVGGLQKYRSVDQFVDGCVLQPRMCGTARDAAWQWALARVQVLFDAALTVRSQLIWKSVHFVLLQLGHQRREDAREFLSARLEADALLVQRWAQMTRIRGARNTFQLCRHHAKPSVPADMSRPATRKQFYDQALTTSTAYMRQ